MHFVARGLDRAGVHPAPDQHHVFGGGVVEAVPAAARRIDHVALARRHLAGLSVDMAVALEHDEELVAMVMPVVLVARARLEHGPADAAGAPSRILAMVPLAAFASAAPNFSADDVMFVLQDGGKPDGRPRNHCR